MGGALRSWAKRQSTVMRRFVRQPRGCAYKQLTTLLGGSWFGDIWGGGGCAGGWRDRLFGNLPGDPLNPDMLVLDNHPDGIAEIVQQVPAAAAKRGIACGWAFMAL